MHNIVVYMSFAMQPAAYVSSQRVSFHLGANHFIL